MTSTNLRGLYPYQAAALDEVKSKNFREALDIAKVRENRQKAMWQLSEAMEQARRAMDPVHELRAKQAFRRISNPCPGGAC